MEEKVAKLEIIQELRERLQEDLKIARKMASEIEEELTIVGRMEKRITTKTIELNIESRVVKPISGEDHPIPGFYDIPPPQPLAQEHFILPKKVYRTGLEEAVLLIVNRHTEADRLHTKQITKAVCQQYLDVPLGTVASVLRRAANNGLIGRRKESQTRGKPSVFYYNNSEKPDLDLGKQMAEAVDRGKARSEKKPRKKHYKDLANFCLEAIKSAKRPLTVQEIRIALARWYKIYVVTSTVFRHMKILVEAKKVSKLYSPDHPVFGGKYHRCMYGEYGKEYGKR